MSDDGAPNPKRRMIRIAKLVFRLLIFGLVCYGIWHTFDKAVVDLKARQFGISQIRPGWLVLAGVFYVAGLLPCWLFWQRTLHAMGQRPRLGHR